MAPTAEQGNLPDDAKRSPSELFKFAGWVHVGLKAEECADAEDGTCGDPLHFHAWCRLPNQFQHQDIRERALAAKARKLRQLRDSETDAFEILDADIAALRGGDREAIVDELVGKDWWKRQLEAMGNVEEREEFQTIERDRQRIVELRAVDADKRPKDEFEELERHLLAYGEAVESEREDLERPLRESYDGLELEELLTQIREARVQTEASEAFMEAYSKWEWLAGTFTMPRGQRRFDTVEELMSAAPEVIEALRATFGEMETSLQRGPAGN